MSRLTPAPEPLVEPLAEDASVGRGRPATVVGRDDVSHDLVPDHVLGLQVHEGEVGHTTQDLFESHQSGAAAGDVHLGHVAGDDRLRAEADPGQEHLHLLGAGVLGLVQDDERVVEGPAAHERQRRHFDSPLVDEALGSLGLEQVVQRVVEGPEVGVDLGQHVPGQKAQPLAGLDGGAGQDDSADLAGLQRLDGQGDGQVRLAGPGGSDPEGHDVAADGVRVGLLTARLGAHGTAPRRAHQFAGQDLGWADVVVEHVDGAVELHRVQAVTGLEQDDELVEEGGDPLGRGGPLGAASVDGDLVAPHGDPHVGERSLDLAQQLIALAEETGHEVVAGNEDLYRGACHVRSACDPTSGPGRSGRIGTVRSAAVDGGRVRARWEVPSPAGPCRTGPLSRGASRTTDRPAGGGGGGEPCSRRQGRR